jgi:hypothetical protein
MVELRFIYIPPGQEDAARAAAPGFSTRFERDRLEWEGKQEEEQTTKSHFLYTKAMHGMMGFL